MTFFCYYLPPPANFLFKIDLGDVIDAFDESFNEQLERVIGKRTSGHYKELLLRIMNAI